MKNKKNLTKTIELGYNLAKANFKLRNEGSYLGIIWYLLEPLSLFIIIILIKGNIGGNPIPNYPLYLLLGLIMFNFFKNSTTLATNSIRNNGNLIKSIKINKEALVLSTVIQFVFSHFFELIILAIFMVYSDLSPTSLIFYIPILFFYFLFVLGISFILATLGAFINDTSNVWGVFTKILWFATPIFYVLHKGTKIYILNLFNPITYFIEITRQIFLFNSLPPLSKIVPLFIISVLTLLIGLKIFQKYENKFAEEM